MLAALEVILHYTGNRNAINQLVQKLSTHNFEGIRFTVHLEDHSARLRLVPRNDISNFDESTAIEEYANRICGILYRNKVKYTIIESLALDNEPQNTTVME